MGAEFDLDVLCEQCSNFTAKWWSVMKDCTSKVQYNKPQCQFSRPLHQLQQSSLAGCHFCARIFSPYRLEMLPVAASDNCTFTVVFEKSGTWLFRLEVERDGRKRWSYPEYVRVCCSSSLVMKREPWSAEIARSTYTGSRAHFNQIRSWLDTCDKQHTQCSVPRIQVTKRPEYLVAVISVPSGGIRCQLVRTISLDSLTLEWATLSHCWGGVPTLRTLMSNLHDHLKDIPMDGIPPLYQEAIRTAFYLNYRYIWIDSLCIIQDNEQHWRQESAIMGSVYRGSGLNIAGLAAGDCHSPLWRPRNPLEFVPLHLTNPTKPGSLLVVPEFDPSLRIEESQWRLESALPLVKRAWVVQELILSPRTVYFGRHNVYFECESHVGNSVALNLAYTGQVPERTQVHSTAERNMPELSRKQVFARLLRLPQLPKPQTLDDLKQLFAHPEFLTFLEGYCSLVFMYSGTKLSFSTDKLVAINGIIQELSAISGYSPISGLWRELLPWSLLWEPAYELTDQPQDGTRYSGNYVAPSWSWASINRQVQHLDNSSPKLRVSEWGAHCPWQYQPSRKFFAKVLDVQVEGLQPNGQIQGAWLRLEGIMRRVRVYGRSGGKYLCASEGATPTLDDDLRHPVQSPCFTEDTQDMDAGLHDGDLWAVLVMINRYSEGSDRRTGLVIAKVRQPSAETAVKKWMRVGTFHGYVKRTQMLKAFDYLDDLLFGNDHAAYIERKTVLLV